MRTYTTTILTTVAALGLVAAAGAESVSFTLILGASEANDMSPDGRWVVGSFAGGGYRWDRETDTYTQLGGISAVAVSDDGSVVLGNIDDPDGIGSQVAAIWTEADGWQSLGLLPGAGACPSRSSAYELSADGSVAVGLAWYDGCNAVGFRWTEAAGMVDLEELANGSNRASVVSADGNVIAGFAQGSFSRTPARWTGDGAGQLLDPPDGDVLGEVYGISDDGVMLLTEWEGDAVIWTESGGGSVEMIGNGSSIPGWGGNPMDIADDGTIVGFDFNFGARQAWIALPAPTLAERTLVRIEDYVPAHGGSLPPGYNAQVCQAISTDGRTIIGHSGIPNGGAWIIQRCISDINGDQVVNVDDLLKVLADWGACSDCSLCAPDINGDCSVDVNDLLSVLADWGACP